MTGGRLYQLARELQMESRHLLDSLWACGSPVKTCLSRVNPATRQLALDLVNGKAIPENAPSSHGDEQLQLMIRTVLAPAQIEEVQVFPYLGRALVLVAQDQLSVAIGDIAKNVRRAAMLVGTDIEIMTVEELTEAVRIAENRFVALPGATPEVADTLIEQGFLDLDEVAGIAPETISQITGLDTEEARQLLISAQEAAGSD